MLKNKKIDRPKRTPLSQRNRLSFGSLDPNYNYRIINDKDDRIKLALEGGYEFVLSDEKLGDVRVAEANSIDSRVCKPVGNGITGYLMRIPKELYDEDQAAKLEAVEELEKAMAPKAKGTIEGAEAYGEGLTKTKT